MMQRPTLRFVRVLGALAVLAVGAVHLQRYGSGYNAVPTIGPLFLLNGIAAVIIGVALLAPLERWVSSRTADALVGILAVGAVAIALGALIALFISEASSLFGFSEHGYDSAIVTAIAAEAATILLLAPVAINALNRFLANRGAARSRSRPRDELRARRGASPVVPRR